jgi:hypothetical protein
MQTIDLETLGNVCGGESFGAVLSAVPHALDVPLAQTSAATQGFIAAHPFFHEGLMNAPIGGGKHFRNVPFIGPTLVAKGLVTGSSDGVRKGIEVTRGTWAAR